MIVRTEINGFTNLNETYKNKPKLVCSEKQIFEQ